jgi:serine/threonine protein kinase
VLHSAEALYLCLDYAGSTDLYKYQMRAPSKLLSVHFAQDIFGQVADGVHHMHKNHVCHRDLKPENIVINGPKACLVDFGLAADTRNVQSLCCGSLPFAAPEVMQEPCQYYGNQVDAWSLGVVLFEMVRGVNSFCRMMDWRNITEPSPELSKQLAAMFAHGLPAASSGNEHPEISDIMTGLLKVPPSQRSTLQEVTQSAWMACRAPSEQSLPKMCGN